jgi:hypothetical protein
MVHRSFYLVAFKSELLRYLHSSKHSTEGQRGEPALLGATTEHQFGKWQPRFFEHFVRKTSMEDLLFVLKQQGKFHQNCCFKIIEVRQAGIRESSEFLENMTVLYF